VGGAVEMRSVMSPVVREVSKGLCACFRRYACRCCLALLAGCSSYGPQILNGRDRPSYELDLAQCIDAGRKEFGYFATSSAQATCMQRRGYIAACPAPLGASWHYASDRPKVDMTAVNLGQYERDLRDCKSRMEDERFFWRSGFMRRCLEKKGYIVLDCYG
jgi:hypothetical protein